MKVSELRIGNIVNHEDDGEIVEGIHYSDSGYKILIGNYLRPIESIKPVPLTEEWIIKLGYKMKRDSGFPQLEYWDENKTSIDFEKKFFYLKRFKHGESHADLRMPEFVHQLQNIYSASTGTELEIKKL